MIDTKMEDDLISEAKKAGIDRFVVGAIISNGRRVLLLQRPIDDFMGGYFELPSGRVEKEESLSQALAREIKEETGQSVERFNSYVGYFDYESDSDSTTRQWTFALSTNDFSVSLSEHISHAWVEPNELSSYKVSPEVAELINTAFELGYV